MTAVVAVILAGCTSGDPPSDPGFDPMAPKWETYIGGLHVRWELDGTMTGIGYALHRGDEVRPVFGDGRPIALTPLLHQWAPEIETIRHDGGRLSPPAGPWEPKEVVAFEVHYTDVSPENVYSWDAYVMGAGGQAHANTGCFQHNSPAPVGSGCQEPTLSSVITPEVDAAEADELLQCCNWLPPPFDLRGLNCVPVGPLLQCSVLVRNWQRAMHEANGEMIAISPTDGAVVARGGLAELGSFQPGEERNATALLPIAGATGISYRVEARVWRAELETSVVNATTDWVPGDPLARSKTGTTDR